MEQTSEERRELMRVLLEAASQHQGDVHTNPLVAAALVKQGELLALAAHEKFGGPHAEAALLNNYRGSLEDTELYCTLEPCVHQGKTEPCVDRLIEAGIKRVTIGHEDPNPLVAGAGVKTLLDAGVEVRLPLLRSQYRWLNRAYFYNHYANLPWLEAKLALSVDGYIGTTGHHSKWLSSPESRDYTHRLRSRVDGVMVGAETVRQDDPSLTDRVTGRADQPRAIVISRRPESLSLDSKLFSERAGQTVLVLPPGSSSRLETTLENRGVKLIFAELIDGRFNWKKLLPELLKLNLSRILVEGGGRLVGDLISSGVLNEIHLFYCGRFLGEGIKSTVLREPVKRVFEGPAAGLIDHRRFGDDLYVRRFFQQQTGHRGFAVQPFVQFDGRPGD